MKYGNKARSPSPSLGLFLKFIEFRQEVRKMNILHDSEFKIRLTNFTLILLEEFLQGMNIFRVNLIDLVKEQNKLKAPRLRIFPMIKKQIFSWSQNFDSPGVTTELNRANWFNWLNQELSSVKTLFLDHKLGLDRTSTMKGWCRAWIITNREQISMKHFTSSVVGLGFFISSIGLPTTTSIGCW